MSASPEVMSALGGGGPPAPPPGGAPPEPAPAAAPMAAPQKPEGQQEGAKVDVRMAMKMLEKALPAFGTGNKNGDAILKALGILGKAFGKDEEETDQLMPAEIKQLLQGLSGPGQPPKPPVAKPGAAPPPRPPGM